MYISDNAELAENKLTILYISKNLGIPLTNNRFTQIVSEGNLFNFFLLQHLLEDLHNSGFLSKKEIASGETTYQITVKGSETLDFLIHKLPKGIRRHIDRLTETKSTAIKRDRDIVSYIEPGNGNSFISVLEVRDGAVLLFSLKYTSGTKKDALAICETLKRDADVIYSRITNDLLK